MADEGWGQSVAITVLLLFTLYAIYELFLTPFTGWTVFVTLAYIIYLGLSIKILNEYQRGVLFTLGRFSGVLGPGIRFIIPFVQWVKIVDLRIRTVDIPPQEVITKDNVSVRVNGVVFFRVIDPAKATLNVTDYIYATSSYAQTTLRDVVGGVTLDDLLERRDEIASEIREIVDEKTDEWGVDITDIKLQDVILPDTMKRAMAVQAEAERERRAIIIKAEGERTAAENYAKAAEIISTIPGAMTLRVLQTVNDISKDPSHKFLILLPVEFMDFIESLKKQRK